VAAAAIPQPLVTQPAPAPATPAPARSVPSHRPEQARSINGRLYFFATGSSTEYSVWTGSGLDYLLDTNAAAWNAEPSPDGKHLAYVQDNKLMLSDADGKHARALRSDAIEVGFGPTWSGDSARIVYGRTASTNQWEAGTVRISDGRYTALPRAIQGGIHYRLSGDGSRVFWSDGQCRILTADADGTHIAKVPVLGDTSSVTNPRRLRACDIVSVDRTGSRMTVSLHKGDEPDGDIGGSQAADAVIDVGTGTVRALPVAGTVRQVLYLRDGTLLVRSGATLTLLSADLQVLAKRAEPAPVRDMVLRDYTY
jgi:hypothetical protein